MGFISTCRRPQPSPTTGKDANVLTCLPPIAVVTMCARSHLSQVCTILVILAILHHALPIDTVYCVKWAMLTEHRRIIPIKQRCQCSYLSDSSHCHCLPPPIVVVTMCARSHLAQVQYSNSETSLTSTIPECWKCFICTVDTESALNAENEVILMWQLYLSPIHCCRRCC